MNQVSFDTDKLKEGLKERAVASVGITIVAQFIKLVLQIGSIAVLARLLDPSDFGLAGMITVFTGLALQFMEGGLSMATIQKDQITHGQISNLFWINSALGALLCVVGVIASPIVADIYDEPRLVQLMSVMSLVFLIGGLSVQHDALLRREMRFKTISIIDISSMAAGIFVGISLALMGFSYWSLIFSAVATITAKTVLRWLNSRWIPSFLSKGTGVRPLLNFGANLTLANFIGYIAKNLTPFAIGYVSGAKSLGIFNSANMLTSIPSSQMMPPVMNVVQPTLSRVADDPIRLRVAITSIMGKLVLITMFVTLTMAVLADLIVYTFLGPAWEGAVPIFRILAFFSIVEPIAGFLAVCLVVTGRAEALLRWKVITFLILAVSISIGSIWGEYGIVIAYSLSGVVFRLPAFLLFASRHLPVSFREFIDVITPSALCAIGTIIILAFLRSLITVENHIGSLIIFLILSICIYASFSLMIKKTRSEVYEMISLLKLLVGSRLNRQ